MDGSLSTGIDRLRAISILGVVCVHATSPLLNSRAGDPVHDPLFWSLVALNQAARFSVPAFFFLAGMLAGEGSFSIGARLRRLLLPYAAWSLLLWGVPEVLRGGAGAGEMGVRLLLGQTFVGGYFLIALAQLALVTPWIVRWASARPREAGWASAALLAATLGAEQVAAFGGDTVAAQRLRDGFSAALSSGVVWAPFFMAGAIAGLRPAAFRAGLVRHAGWLVVLAAVALPLSILEFRLTLDATMSVGLAATFLKPSSVALAAAIGGLALVVPAGPAASRCLLALAPASFAIYLVHGAVIQAVLRVTPDPGASLVAAWIGVSCAVIAGVALPLALHALAARRFPAPLRMVLFGRLHPGGRSGRVRPVSPPVSPAAPSGAAPSWSGTTS